MNSRSRILLTVIALIVFSSGCIEGQDTKKDLVKEGTQITYDNPGHGNTTYTFFNGTEDTIKVREASGGTLEFYTVYRENLTSLGEKQLLIASPNRYTENRTKRNEIRAMMQEGGKVKIYRNSEKVLEVTRGEKTVFKGIEAYRLTFESEDVTYRNIVTAEKPYLLLNSSSNRGQGLKLEKIERNVELNMSDYSNQQALNEEDEIPSNVKASSTELEFSEVYSTENEEGERIISVLVRNTGERDIDPENFKITYSPDQYTDFKAFEDLDEMWKTGSTCNIYGGVLRPSGSFQCDTGLKFPGPEREVGIKIESTEFDYEKEYSCSPVTEGSRTC